jgi:hypothetical protein
MGPQGAGLGKGPKPLTPVSGLSLFWQYAPGWFSIFVVACALVMTNDAFAALLAALAVVSLAAAYFLGRKAVRSSSQPAQVTNVTRPA